MTIEAMQLNNESSKLSEGSVAAFRKTMRGPVFTQDDPGYDEAKVIWSREYTQRRPALVARCSGVADVVDAVNFAREHSLLTSVRGGGHSIQGFGTCEGGLMIDLSRMSMVFADPQTRVARVQGGATLGDVDRETTRVGLAVPTGVAPTTGMGGLTLGGGVGWLHRKYGLTLDNLRSVEIVLASGEVVRTSADSEPELFWAIRGGGGNFGVVTEFEFDAHPVPDQMALALVSYPMDQMPEVIRKWRDWTMTAPDEVTSRMISLAPIPHPNMDEVLRGQDIVMVGALHSGTYDEGAPIIEPLRHLGEPLLDLSGAWGFRELQTKFDLIEYGSCSGYWKSLYVDQMADEVLDIAVEWSNKRPVGTAVTQLMHMGGAVGRVGATDTAFGDRSANYLVSAEAAWFHPAEREKCISWAQGLTGDVDALPYSRGTYLNFNNEVSDDSRGAQFGENVVRLRRAKKQYDPENLFRVNNNIAVG